MPKEREAFYRRLVLAFEAFVRRGGSQSELARRGGWSQGTVSQWLNPDVRAMPDGESMLVLPRALEVSARWLLAGIGEMADAPAAPGELYYRGADAMLGEVSSELEELVTRLRARWEEEQRRAREAEATAAAARLSDAERAAAARKKKQNKRGA
jgi:transcriptional regulator with XRE-family HTH domain